MTAAAGALTLAVVSQPIRGPTMPSLPRHRDHESQPHEPVRHSASGWYPDPFEPGKLRWFDGQRWTARKIPDHTAESDEPLATRAAPLHSLSDGQARVADLLSGVRSRRST